MKKPLSIGIIGTGIAGASLARMLACFDQDIHVTLVEKSRGVGGRMATRRNDAGLFDHGAQFFTTRSDEFAHFLHPFRKHFVDWDAKVTTLSPDSKSYQRPWFEKHFVGVPAMPSLCKAIISDLDVHVNQQIHSVGGTPGAWYLESEDTFYGPFDWIVSTAPASQSADLLNVSFPNVNYDSTFTVMAPLQELPNFDAAVVKDSPIEWLVVTSNKPGREECKPSLIAHADPNWTASRLNDPLCEVQQALFTAIANLGVSIDQEKATIHRWRFSRVSTSLDTPFFLDCEKQIAACGDWCQGPRVEDAFTSAHALFTALSQQLRA